MTERQAMSSISPPVQTTVARRAAVDMSAIVRASAPEDAASAHISFAVNRINLWYGQSQALKDVSMDILSKRVTALIGPSGCGKSTLLRCFNRMNDLVDNCRVEGRIELDGVNIYDRAVNVAQLRQRVGMVFQKPNPFPKSVYENVAYGLRILGVRDKHRLDESVERALRRAALWDEVKDRLQASGMSLSGGQQQRLVIARALALEPEVLLLDEPTSALDPISTAKVEELVSELRHDVTIIIVTHNMQQAARVSDYTAYMYLGELIEFGQTEKIFLKPSRQETEDYITGRFG